MKDTIIGIMSITLVIATIIAMTVLGLRIDRFVKPYQEETRRQTWENSISRNQGVNHLIAGYCMNLRTATDDGSRKAFAHLILDQSMSYSGELTGDTAACVAEAQSALR